MSAAVASLIALIIAIALSVVTRLNVGLIALALAWVVGVYIAGLKPDVVIGGFPAALFLTLAGVTLLFAAADANGTLERLAQRALRLARGDARVLPLLFFAIACMVSSIGPGAISSVALVAPLGMTLGTRAGVPPFLTALMIANGANAGNLSPISSVGIIANSTMAGVGLGGHEFKVWLANFVAHAIVAVAAYIWLQRRIEGGTVSELTPVSLEPFTAKQRATVIVIALWIISVIVLKVNLGLSAFAAATVLFLARVGDDGTAIKRVPWGVIVMVCGVSVLIGVLEDTGGMELFTALLSRLATPETANAVLAFVTGTISTYSSTSGVVLPAFLPTVPGLVTKLGGGDPLAFALSINVGSSLVNVSPLSTLGALCLAALPAGSDPNRLFRQLLLWGVSMTVVGAILCWLLIPPLVRA